jgi:hypothetical protein
MENKNKLLCQQYNPVKKVEQQTLLFIALLHQ